MVSYKRRSGKSVGGEKIMGYCDGLCKHLKDYKLRLGERAILNHYGITEQVAKLKEECRELIEAADGYINGTDSKAHFLEEIADVLVMIEQMIMHFNAQDRVDEIKRFKVKRQLGRIEREEDNV